MLKLICARNSRPESMRSRRKTSSISKPRSLQNNIIIRSKQEIISSWLYAKYVGERDILNGSVGRPNLGIQTSKQCRS